MRSAYLFSVLRYVHDAVAQEFVSVGVVVYSPSERFLSARCTNRYRRAASLFDGIDGAAFRRVTGFVEREINRLGQHLSTGLPMLGDKIEPVLARVLPADDSSMQFSTPGAGVSADLERTVGELYERHVTRYERVEEERRDEEDVWRTFRDPLAQRGVVHYLHPKKVIAPNYEYDFQHAWKNARWHALEPISFDLTQERYILEKASHWVGRMTSLQGAQEDVKLHVLLGEPQDDKLSQAFVKAKNLLHERMPSEHEFHGEDEAEEVADWLADEIGEHQAESPE